MVRIIVGTLVDMGRGRINEPFLDIIQSKLGQDVDIQLQHKDYFSKVHY